MQKTVKKIFLLVGLFVFNLSFNKMQIDYGDLSHEEEQLQVLQKVQIQQMEVDGWADITGLDKAELLSSIYQIGMKINGVRTDQVRQVVEKKLKNGESLRFTGRYNGKSFGIDLTGNKVDTREYDKSTGLEPSFAACVIWLRDAPRRKTRFAAFKARHGNGDDRWE